MKARTIQWLVTVIIILGNLIWWLIPSNIDYLIVHSREVLLGRYSVDRLSAMLIVMLICWPALYLIWAGRDNIKRRSFKVIAVLFGLIAGILLVDAGARMWRAPRYQQTEDVYHRQPNSTITGVFKDVPETQYSYPKTPPGHPDVQYTLTVDERGFRNTTNRDKYDVLILGDSFAEGAEIPDEESWPALYAAASGDTVYNLGMSGGNPGTYVETLQKFGLQFSPETVVCMIYEGNDFKNHFELVGRIKQRSSLKRRLRAYYKLSPVRLALKDFLTKNFSGVGHLQKKVTASEQSEVSANISPALSWLPLAIPEGPDAKHYAFQLKRLLYHYRGGETFASSNGCKTAFLALEKLQEICRENNARLVIIFAPDKPHVLMPLVEKQVQAEQIRDFLALKERKLPPPAETKATLYANLNAQEETIEDYCRQKGIDFVSITQSLRDAIGKGEQAYFTYNQHWSPTGHKIVAERLNEHMGKL